MSCITLLGPVNLGEGQWGGTDVSGWWVGGWAGEGIREGTCGGGGASACAHVEWVGGSGAAAGRSEVGGGVGWGWGSRNEYEGREGWGVPHVHRALGLCKLHLQTPMCPGIYSIDASRLHLGPSSPPPLNGMHVVPPFHPTHTSHPTASLTPQSAHPAAALSLVGPSEVEGRQHQGGNDPTKQQHQQDDGRPLLVLAEEPLGERHTARGGPVQAIKTTWAASCCEMKSKTGASLSQGATPWGQCNFKRASGFPSD